MDLFMSMPFSAAFDEVSRAVMEVATDRRLVTYRADQENLAKLIPQTISQKIRESRIFLADITGNNPNVLQEHGQAQALGKPLIVISQNEPEGAAFNVRSSTIIRYNPQMLAELQVKLHSAFLEATSPNETLRAMIVPASLGQPTSDSRFVIAASPLGYRRASGRSGGYKKMRRTYSDLVGIRGILQGFGLLYGFDTLPDLVDPEDYDDVAMTLRMNLYCIASPKANRWTAKLLQQYHQHYVPHIDFRADSASPDLKNVDVSIYSNNALLMPPGWKENTEKDRYGRDFGIIIRGPNPAQSDQMVAVIAGRSSLGTEAACRAFTDVKAITEIRTQLAGMRIDIDDHKQAFWALIGMRRALGDEKEEAIAETLAVYQVGKLHPI